MDGELKKEQIDTLFVHVGLLQGEFWGGWVVQRGSHQFFERCSITFFCPPAVAKVLYVSWDCLSVRKACPVYVLILLLWQGRCPFAPSLVMLCTNNCHKCWKLMHNF